MVAGLTGATAPPLDVTVETAGAPFCVVAEMVPSCATLDVCEAVRAAWLAASVACDIARAEAPGPSRTPAARRIPTVKPMTRRSADTRWVPVSQPSKTHTSRSARCCDDSNDGHGTQ